VEQLIGLDEGRWGEWRGPNDDRPPCKLTQPQLANCCAHLASVHERSGLCDVGPAIKAAGATCARNSNRPGPPIARRPTHRHSRVKSYGCCDSKPSQGMSHDSRRSQNRRVPVGNCIASPAPSYVRVSTAQQGKSGLGLPAQQETVSHPTSYAGDWVTRSIRRRGEPAFR
jgi:hypothetical protein